MKNKSREDEAGLPACWTFRPRKGFLRWKKIERRARQPATPTRVISWNPQSPQRPQPGEVFPRARIIRPELQHGFELGPRVLHATELGIGDSEFVVRLHGTGDQRDHLLVVARGLRAAAVLQQQIREAIA